jgi:hypothetical protein
VAGRRAAGIGAKGAAAGAIGAGAPFVGDSNGLPDRLGMGAGDVGSGCCTEISISPDADGAGARMMAGIAAGGSNA